MELFPFDVLNYILIYLDYKSCLACFSLSKRFYALNTNEFWKNKIQLDFESYYHKSFYTKQMFNYLASMYTMLSKSFCLDLKLRQNDLDKLSTIFIKYLKANYINNFKVIKNDYFVNTKYYTLHNNDYQTGKQLNLVVNRKKDYVQFGFFIDDKTIQFINTDYIHQNSPYIQFPSAFTNFIEDLGLNLRDVWKLYDIPSFINVNWLDKFCLPPAQRGTFSFVMINKIHYKEDWLTNTKQQDFSQECNFNEVILNLVNLVVNKNDLDFIKLIDS